MHDVVILGAGPAGITAGVYAARKKLNTLIISKDIGGQAALSSEIENYTGYQMISGIELSKKFEDQVKEFENIKVMEGVEVTCIDQTNNGFKVTTTKGEFDGRTIIVATGRKPRELGVPGETDYTNKGVTYCATCDAPLFSKKDVAIIGGGNSALDAALQLTVIANKVYLITVNDAMAGDEIMIEKVKAAQNIEIITNANTKEIIGKQFVTGIQIEVEEKNRMLDVQGIFIEIGSIPVKEPGECEGLELNDKDEIVVNPKCETNIPGLFAAGDVTNVPEKQIIVAAGQGCIASLSAFSYLMRQKR